MPIDNDHAVTYTIEVITSDIHIDVEDHTFTTTFDIIVNDPPIILTMTSQSLKAPDGLNWQYGAALTSDPEGLSYTKSLLFNGSSTIPSWISYNLTDYSFTIVTSHNNYVGIHSLTVVIQDDYNDPVSDSFSLTVTENTSPQRLQFISNYGIVNFNYLFIQFLPVDELFSDPDGREMTVEMTQADGNPLPAFLAYNSVENTLSGTPLLVHVGDWFLSYHAVDDHGIRSNITFTLAVMP